jgi:drug/metabolite transporter (DMT)-like permease
LLGVWVAGEVVSGFEWLAAGVILMGVVLMLWSTRRQAQQAKPNAPSQAPLHDQPELEH